MLGLSTRAQPLVESSPIVNVYPNVTVNPTVNAPASFEVYPAVETNPTINLNPTVESNPNISVEAPNVELSPTFNLTVEVPDSWVGTLDASFRGTQKIKYSWKATTALYINPGPIHIWYGTSEGIYYLESQLSYDMTSLSANSWHALYVQMPDSGSTLTGTQFSHSTVMPTFNQTKLGWYDSTGAKRCIGFIRSDASGYITNFQRAGADIIIAAAFTDVNGVTPSTTWTTGTLTVPVGGITAICVVTGAYVNATAGLNFRRKGWATHYGLLTVSAGSQWVATESRLPTDSNKQVEFSYSTATTNVAYIYPHGFVMPDFM